MIRLDNALLTDLGLDGLSVSVATAMLSFMYSELEMRVGKELTGRLSETQMDEFEALVDGADETGALAWLEANVPDYQDVVRRELDLLQAEVASNAQEIRTIVLAMVPDPRAS
jgi:hypothetical protein